MNHSLALSILAFSTACAAAQVRIARFEPDGGLTLTGAYSNGVCTLERADTVTGPWRAERNLFTTNHDLRTSLALGGPGGFFRARAMDVSAGNQGFTNLIQSYGILSTVAGAGGTTGSGTSKWQTAFEGGPATNALLSRPHIAMADAAGNIYIADKEAHAVRKVRPDGVIITVAGTGVPGNGADSPTPGAQVALNEPNGLFVLANGTVYILDMQNGKIRRLDTNAFLTTRIDQGGPIAIGRGLWVSEDESVVYYAAGTLVKKWTPANGLTDYSIGYSQLGNLAMDPWGRLVVTDRSANYVYRIETHGAKTIIAGNGSVSGGGEGQPAIATGLNQVRAVCFFPSGAFLAGTDNGSQVWYVDTAGTIHLFLQGSGANAHAGDGTWFYAPNEPRVSKVRAIVMDHGGDLLITEHDAGYVRRIRFLPPLGR